MDKEREFAMINNCPILGICGWSGSGKTTLIEAVLPRLVQLGLRVVVIKHDVHGVDVDRPGKDSDRFFRAGADVLLQGTEEFIRLHTGSERDLLSRIRSIQMHYDLILVEGHKTTPLPKVWLLNEGENKPPPVISGIMKTFARDSTRTEMFMDFLTDWLPGQWRKTPIFGCIAIQNMNRMQDRTTDRFPKEGTILLRQLAIELRKIVKDVVLAGSGVEFRNLDGFTSLPEAPDATGPLAGLLSAMRWNPMASWLVVNGSAQKNIELWRWLLTARTPGIWIILPKVDGISGSSSFPAYFDFRSRSLLENLLVENIFDVNRLSHNKIIRPRPPKNLKEF